MVNIRKGFCEHDAVFKVSLESFILPFLVYWTHIGLKENALRPKYRKAYYLSINQLLFCSLPTNEQCLELIKFSNLHEGRYK